MNAKVRVFRSELNDITKMKFFKQSLIHKAVTIKQTLSDLSYNEVIYDGLFSIEKNPERHMQLFLLSKGKNY